MMLSGAWVAILLARFASRSCSARAGRMLLAAASSLCLLIAFTPPTASAQATIGSIPFELESPAGHQVKVENGWVLFWVPTTSDSSLDQVELFTPFGEKILSLKPLLAVQGSKRSAIWDVSAGPSGLVAVAAQFMDSQGRGTGSLLLYNASGELIGDWPVPGGNDIFRLEVDQDDSIWAIGMGIFGKNGNDPSTVEAPPLLLHIGPDGNILSELTTQPQFRLQNSVEIIKDGDLDASLGITGDRVWFYLPGLQELLTLGRDGGNLKIVNTGVPVPPSGGPFRDTEIRHASYLADGTLLAQVDFFSPNARYSSSNLYAWSHQTNRWTALQEDEIDWQGTSFLGVEGNRLAVLNGKTVCPAYLGRFGLPGCDSFWPTGTQVLSWYSVASVIRLPLF
jgi:hypothetical protein